MSHSAPRQRFLVLEGIRGICAIIVALLHVPGAPKPGHGYLAVDMFFLLSGFVIANAYERELIEGKLSPNEFLKLRFIRLYPLFALGLALGFVDHITRLPDENWSWTLSLLAGLVGLPVKVHYCLFPINFALWSLLAEALAYIAYTHAVSRLQGRGLAIILAMAFALLLRSHVYSDDGINLGIHWNDSLFGLARVAFSFTLGVTMFRYMRLPQQEALPARNVPAISILVIVAVLLTSITPSPDFILVFDLAMIAMVFPALLWLATRIRMSPWLGSLMAVMGVVSYPLYAIHLPIGEIVNTISRNVFNTDLRTSTPYSGLAIVILCCGIAYGLDRLFDQPVRKGLRRLLTGHSKRPATARA